MSKFELQDKIAIVTGGAGGVSGTGRHIALEYAKAGANVVVASRNQENLDKVAAEIKALGRDSLAVATDITVPEQVDNMVKQTVDKFGRIDILVNNAGAVLFHKQTVEEVSFEEWNAEIAFNLTGPFLCCLAAGKVMKEQEYGRIINLSSGGGMDLGSPRWLAYGAAKAGVINLTQGLAVGWAPHNINVNCIAPGLIGSEANRHMREVDVRAGKSPSDSSEGSTPVPPVLRVIGAENVALLAVFLGSAAADHITGEVMRIRGLGSSRTP